MSTGSPLWELEPAHGVVTVPRALIGVSGDNLSLMIDRSQLSSDAPFTAFRWDVDAETVVSPGIEPYDCAPNTGDAVYPPGSSASPAPMPRCIL